MQKFTFCLVGLLSTLALMPSDASAQDKTVSETEVLFNGTQRLYRGNTYEITWPANQPVAIHAVADVNANLIVAMKATSILEWPEILTQKWQGITDASSMKLDADMDLKLDATVDLSNLGIPLFNYDIWSSQWRWKGDNTFTSLLLPGGSPAAASVTIQPTELYALDTTDWCFDVPFTTTYAACVAIWGDITPDVKATLIGQRVNTNGENITIANGTALLEAPTASTGKFKADSYWEAKIDAIFNVVFTPAGTITLQRDDNGTPGDYTDDVRIGDVSLEYPYSWPMDTDDRIFKTKPVSYEHDVPALSLSQAAVDMGTLLIGESKEVTLTVSNLGAIDLSGTADLSGEFYTINQPDISASQTLPDSLILTFTPEAEGTFTGEIVLSTNDPVQPSVTITLTGVGTNNANEVGPGGDTGEVAEIKGCGCSSSSTPLGFGFNMGLLLIGLGFRRRSR